MYIYKQHTLFMFIYVYVSQKKNMNLNRFNCAGHDVTTELQEQNHMTRLKSFNNKMLIFESAPAGNEFWIILILFFFCLILLAVLN